MENKIGLFGYEFDDKKRTPVIIRSVYKPSFLSNTANCSLMHLDIRHDRILFPGYSGHMNADGIEPFVNGKRTYACSMSKIRPLKMKEYVVANQLFMGFKAVYNKKTNEFTRIEQQ